MANIELQAWGTILAASRPDPTVAPVDPADHHEPTAALYGPLLGGPLVIAHLAQSLDGCVALHTGESQWISGPEDVVHTHRLRAIVDAVVVGVKTAIEDDPQLTVRECDGPDPVRVVLDPAGRAPAHLQLFTDGGATIRLVAEATRPYDVVCPSTDGVFAPADVLAVLADRGLHRVLVEGGGVTVSRFITAGCIDRLHLVIAPVLIGGGRRAFPLPLADLLVDVPRMCAAPMALGNDWLFDCPLSP